MSIPRAAPLTAFAFVLLVVVAGRAEDRSGEVGADEETVRAAIERGLEYLLAHQNEDGSFGGHKNATFTSAFANPHTYFCWQVGSTALAAEALIRLRKDSEATAAADRALRFLEKHARLRRPAEWDLDNNWGLIYGLNTLAIALQDPRWAGGDRAESLTRAARIMLDGLKRYQGARGGFGYYADPEAAWRPDWGTSFTTAAAILAMVEARRAGFDVDDKMFAAAVRAVRRARLPNGAFAYDVAAVPRHMRLESIDQVKGSLGRIQVCNVALIEAGEPVAQETIEEGVDNFFRHHRFLDVARNRPIPHEAYYANAAYFYLFGHYYAASAIGRIADAARRAEAFQRLRPEILKCQQADGSMWDFWIASNTRIWGTAFGIMGLAATLEGGRS